MSYLVKMYRRKRLEKRRQLRLREKAQKAKVIDRLPEILEKRSWNARFRAINSLSHS